MPRTTVPPGSAADAHWTVSADDTAAALGSGELDVLATPRLLAWMEYTACLVLADLLDDSETSVGTRASLEHLKASPIGARVDVTATVTHVDGRLVRFETIASDSAGAVLGRSELTRVVVDTDRFLARLGVDGG